MATLPTVPTFTANTSPSVATLNQLGTAVKFVSQMPIVVSLKMSGTQSIAVNTSTPLSWGTEEVDSDGMHNATNPTRLTSATQGYYKFHATVAMNETATAAYTACWFKRTTGVNNPLGAGVTVDFGGSAFLSATTTSDFRSMTIASISPCLYIGDYVEVVGWSSVAATIQSGFLNSGNLDNAGAADGASCVYGYYLFEGP